MRPGSPLAITGSLLLAVIMLAAVIAPFVAPNDPFRVDLARRLESPDSADPLGTDYLGRCVLSRVIWGARASLGGAFLVSLGAITIGWIAGTLAAVSGRRFEALVRRVIDIGLAFPGVALALVSSGVIGPGLLGLIVGLAVALAAWWARFVHDVTRLALSKEYVLGALVAGVSRRRIMRHYVLPQVVPLLAVALTWRFGLALSSLAGLSYLGFGAQPPTPEWGAMLHEGRIYLGHSLWPTLAPGLAITVTVGACVMIAEGLKDFFHVRTVVDE
jgi:ABC-type dipeptide/oligopeptide/nickel transport system permease subunit